MACLPGGSGIKSNQVWPWHSKSLLVLFFLLSHELKAQASEQMSIPRDTTYTLYQRWLKIKNIFPEAAIK